MNVGAAFDIGPTCETYAFERDCALDLSEPGSGPSGSSGSRITGTVVVGQIVRSSDVSHLSNLESTISVKVSEPCVQVQDTKLLFGRSQVGASLMRSLFRIQIVVTHQIIAKSKLS